MSNISMVEAKLPPGFRFHPRDDELVCDYLMNKISHCDPLLMIEVDLNKNEPWDIPEIARVGEKEWYFYSQRDRKYATGLRTNRATTSGYWKATGKDRPILRKNTLVGMRKTLVFYQGRAPKGSKTEWVMHEFRLEGPLGPPKLPPQKEDWVLCRVFYKNRDIAAIPSMGSSYDDKGSSFPSLMDSYINFETQPGLLDVDQFEQVPCFSINVSAANQVANPSMNGFPNMPQPDPDSTSGFGQVPIGMTATSTDPDLDSFSSCDKKVMRAVLDHFASCKNMGINPISVKLGSPGLGDQGSSESNLSHEVGMPNIWNPYSYAHLNWPIQDPNISVSLIGKAGIEF